MVQYYFDDPRCKFGKGQIQVQTEFPFYEPGNTINGKVYLEIFHPMEAKHIEIEIKGGEKTSFIRYWHEQEDDRQVEKHEKLKKKRHFLGFKSSVLEIPN